MSAFFLFQNHGVSDEAAFAEYRRLVPAIVARYGGAYRVLGGTVEVVEGPFTLTSPVLIEFPTMTAAHAWYESEEYAPLKAMRFASLHSTGVLVEGL